MGENFAASDSEIFRFSSRVVEEDAADDPVTATFMGVRGHDDRLTDFSSEAADERARHVADWLSQLHRLPVRSERDRLAVAVMTERLQARLMLHQAGEHLRDCSTWGPAQAVRDVFTLMPLDDIADWERVAARLRAVPGALASVRAALEAGQARRAGPARRQVLVTAHSVAVIAGQEAHGNDPAEDWFAALVSAYQGEDPQLSRLLHEGAAAARTAFAELAEWLRAWLAPRCDTEDAAGEDRYRALVRLHCGTDLDLIATYQWGWAELSRIQRRMQSSATSLYGHDNATQALSQIASDPTYTLIGAEATRAWLQQLMDTTITDFTGRHFDIPEAIRRCEARLAPIGAEASPYYTQPSEDFTRPGCTWLPRTPDDKFPGWSLPSAWYHESVPGHHLQFGYAMLQRDGLSRFQRLLFIPGHGEGWALYAERLMDELGYFADPGHELGYLSEQALRAARVVVDIGLHLRLPIPADTDPQLLDGIPGDPRGQTWNGKLAQAFLAARTGQSSTFAASEIDRYLGAPAQAIAYKVGEREWLAAREDATQSAGPRFDLKEWHTRALALGPLSLDLLRAELAGAPHCQT